MDLDVFKWIKTGLLLPSLSLPVVSNSPSLQRLLLMAALFQEAVSYSLKFSFTLMCFPLALLFCSLCEASPHHSPSELWMNEFPQGHLAFGVVDENFYSSVSNQDSFSLAAQRNFFFIPSCSEISAWCFWGEVFCFAFFPYPQPFCSVGICLLKWKHCFPHLRSSYPVSSLNRLPTLFQCAVLCWPLSMRLAFAFVFMYVYACACVCAYRSKVSIGVSLSSFTLWVVFHGCTATPKGSSVPASPMLGS